MNKFYDFVCILFPREGHLWLGLVAHKHPLKIGYPATLAPSNHSGRRASLTYTGARRPIHRARAALEPSGARRTHRAGHGRRDFTSRAEGAVVRGAFSDFPARVTFARKSEKDATPRGEGGGARATLQSGGGERRGNEEDMQEGHRQRSFRTGACFSLASG